MRQTTIGGIQIMVLQCQRLLKSRMMLCDMGPYVCHMGSFEKCERGWDGGNPTKSVGYPHEWLFIKFTKTLMA